MKKMISEELAEDLAADLSYAVRMLHGAATLVTSSLATDDAGDADAPIKLIAEAERAIERAIAAVAE